MREHAPAIAEVVGAVDLEIARAVGVDVRAAVVAVAEAEVVGRRVPVLRGARLPAQADVGLAFLCLAVVAGVVARAGRRLGRVVVIVVTDVRGEVLEERVLVAAVEVHLERRAAIQALLDVGVPVADVEAARVRQVEAALERRLVAGLREAAETVVGEEAGVAGQREVAERGAGGGGGGRRGLRGGCRSGSRLRERDRGKRRGEQAKTRTHGHGSSCHSVLRLWTSRTLRKVCAILARCRTTRFRDTPRESCIKSCIPPTLVRRVRRQCASTPRFASDLSARRLRPPRSPAARATRRRSAR